MSFSESFKAEFFHHVFPSLVGMGVMGVVGHFVESVLTGVAIYFVTKGISALFNWVRKKLPCP